MSDSSLNIKLSYLYRDAGNYKQFGDIIFSNPENLSIENVNSKLKSLLIDGENFVASKWQIPALQNFPYDEELDHNWHEFESIEYTKEEATDKRSISKFLGQISQLASHPKNPYLYLNTKTFRHFSNNKI